jgi:polysaccharide pyruvyl transferase WcaK-like protein
MKHNLKRAKKLAFFGHFDSTNFGNESTLKAILYNLRRFRPDSEVVCICTGPDAAAATYNVNAIPVSHTFAKFWRPRAPAMKVVRRLFIGLLGEPYQWIRCIHSLWSVDTFIVPGTGLLTDAYGLLGWGPYNLFKWSLVAKICRCRLLFVSIGAGPIYGAFGRCFVKSLLYLSDFRSYRDVSTRQFLNSIGYPAESDGIYPDLAFSLPECTSPDVRTGARPVVGIGVMADAGKYSVPVPSYQIYHTYLESLVMLVKWLLSSGYDIRLLSGDLADTCARQQFMEMLRENLITWEDGRIIDEPIVTVEELMSQIRATDLVVATRFHNVVLSLLCNKPVISVSFHHKCRSLMSAVGLAEYCLDIGDLEVNRLIESFRALAANSHEIAPLIKKRSKEYRESLDEQYEIIFGM